MERKQKLLMVLGLTQILFTALSVLLSFLAYVKEIESEEE